MYKIMIADDEPIVLDSLKTFPWSDHQCCVTCFAENGLNALHTLESEKVDILISDIRPGAFQSCKRTIPGNRDHTFNRLCRI